MMKKISILFITCLSFYISFAQRENREEEKGLGFRKENVFFGGSIALGYGSAGGTLGGSNFVIGANPEVGYSLAEWVDAGLAFNAIFNNSKYSEYFSAYNAYLTVNQSAFNYGIGAFTRIHPFNSFFIQIQPEQNWISYKTTVQNQPSLNVRNTVQASSFLIGAGYGQRVIGQTSFFTVLMFDLGTERFSPYRDGYGKAVPIIRGGFNWYLKPSKKKK